MTQMNVAWPTSRQPSTMWQPHDHGVHRVVRKTSWYTVGLFANLGLVVRQPRTRFREDGDMPDKSTNFFLVLFGVPPLILRPAPNDLSTLAPLCDVFIFFLEIFCCKVRKNGSTVIMWS